jgi:hypothetical protein
MKKKVIIGVFGGLLAIFTMLSINTPLSNAGDISLKNVATMAQANAENPLCPTGCYENGNGCYCYIWGACWRTP